MRDKDVDQTRVVAAAELSQLPCEIDYSLSRCIYVELSSVHQGDILAF
ncbi:MAG TPA: hypothetical protein VGH31_05370 [Acidimicrobiales bacterium]